SSAAEYGFTCSGCYSAFSGWPEAGAAVVIFSDLQTAYITYSVSAQMTRKPIAGLVRQDNSARTIRGSRIPSQSAIDGTTFTLHPVGSSCKTRLFETGDTNSASGFRLREDATAVIGIGKPVDSKSVSHCTKNGYFL
ncbi:hypothetical protein RB213_000373, partial [Colletotrichum asianum]